MDPKKHTTPLGGRILSLETGTMARGADASVLVSYGDTVALVAVTTKPPEEKVDFLPLLVEYREQTYAAGKIPGGFFKREGRPRDREILYGRAIDRSIRPQFPAGMMDEVEIVVLLLSYDMENPGLLPGIIGASTALCASSLPFPEPLGAATIGRMDGHLILNPTNSQLEKSDFELLLVGRPGSISMIEFGGREIPEPELWEAVEFGMKAVEQTYDMQREFLSGLIVEKREPTFLQVPDELAQRVEELYSTRIIEVLLMQGRNERYRALENLGKEAAETLAEEFPDLSVETKYLINQLAERLMREYVIREGRRVDGRRPDELRPITCQLGLLPRTHGSALFTRGETQALVVTTLGTEEDVQRLTELEYYEEKRFMLHYNFPPFSTGEVRAMRGPARREIGHGALAEKALSVMMPDTDRFPYIIRIVSDITESNGSTSMATVCGGSLSLMDAGVPIERHVAGISVGLIKDGGKNLLLTDILGMEDHFGDMDFKVAGTERGVNAVQLDLKLRGLEPEVLRSALERAREVRMTILDIMSSAISRPRDELSRYAPKVVSFPVPYEKIGDIIGSGGRTIRSIQDATGTKIEINDTDSRVMIAGDDMERVNEAKRIVESIVREPEIGETYKAKVIKITNFGAFVELAPKKEALLHISDIAWERTPTIEDVLKIGDIVEVKVTEIDPTGKIKVSRKALLPKPEGFKERGAGKTGRTCGERPRRPDRDRSHRKPER
ncbi:MAG: polyribonucleotide nucleotidyltransferase [candidate division WOR-3 bacterium]